MNLLEVVSDGFADVRAHAGRTALQTLGVVLGVASVVGTMGLMAGERAQSMKYWSETGGVLKMIVYPQPATVVRGTARQQASRGLTVDDVEAIRARIAGFELVEPSVRRRELVQTVRLAKTYTVMRRRARLRRAPRAAGRPRPLHHRRGRHDLGIGVRPRRRPGAGVLRHRGPGRQDDPPGRQLVPGRGRAALPGVLLEQEPTRTTPSAG